MNQKQRIKLAKVDFYKFCMERGYDQTEILSKTRKRPVVTMRTEAANFLKDKGYSFLVIGAALGRHYSSIMYFCKPGMRRIKHEVYLRRKRSQILDAASILTNHDRDAQYGDPAINFDQSDTWVDKAGYSACGGEISTE